MFLTGTRDRVTAVTERVKLKENTVCSAAALFGTVPLYIKY